MFERFTDRARRVVVLAQEEARMLDHDCIGTEHLLLGLIHEGDGVAAKALAALGIDLQTVRQHVEGYGGHEPARPGEIPFTPRAKKVLELSLREALQLGHNYIGTEHILLGLIREGEGIAAKVLMQLVPGPDESALNRVRQEVIRLLPGYQPKEGPRPVPTGHPTMAMPLPPPTSTALRVNYDLRLEALRQAREWASETSDQQAVLADGIVDAAEKFYAFLTGTNTTKEA